MHKSIEPDGKMQPSYYDEIDKAGNYLSYKYDELDELLLKLPNSDILLVERVNYRKEDSKESILVAFLIPEHQSVVIHTYSFVYSVDRYEDGIQIHLRTPTQNELWVIEEKGRSWFFKGFIKLRNRSKPKKKFMIRLCFFLNNPKILKSPYHIILNNIS